tara:strand:+ start:236 stop:1132 length:897 start_codon:yes stop_codon:yes gene_type:complete
MNNSQVAHIWANQSKTTAKGSNFFFNNNSIYSYGHHFEVARLVQTEKGNKTIALFEPRTYSNSTNRHQSLAKNAVHGLHESFDFQLPSYDLTRDDFLRSFNRFGNIVIDSLKKSKRAIKYKDWHIRDAVNAVEQWNKLKAYFPTLTKGIKKLKTLDQHQIDKLVESEKKQKAIEAKKRKKEIDAKIKLWLNHDINSLPHDAKTMIRQKALSKNFGLKITSKIRLLNEIETSRGAIVPLDHAKLFFNAIKRFEKNPNECKSRFRVGHFTLDRLTTKGAKIGCHLLEWKEINRFAKTMNW